jgi:hypothetical protein
MTSILTVVTRTLVVAGLLFSLRCAVATAQQLSGSGEWESLTSGSMRGTWTASLVRAGNKVQGTVSLTGSNVISLASVTGSIDGSSVMLGVAADGARQATFSGKLQGGSIKGEWELDSDVLTDHGVWYGKLGPAATAQ